MLRIKEIAKEKGISMGEIAQKLGISPVGFSKTINGNPTLETLLKIASVLDVDVLELIESSKPNQYRELFEKVGDTYRSIGYIKK
ncbi:helix-turn-helix domain-containing protein [Riemerella columbipharyngis]|uniref:Helix-turn-helix n=1 Tax=Riemerella columbipharyngis TaxID=1071918 RepID=A0A1G7DA54_9FLAO|nr:helix-turn-helix transcriptional regulator [Riemerella columbipharyngis]SDE48393.1 Helix-turn-helix [Riemerella columbipharyngis]